MLPVISVSPSMGAAELRDAIQAGLAPKKAAIVRGYFSEAEVENGLQGLRRSFDASRDQATIGETPDQVMTNFQKMNIGGIFNTRIYRPRFLRAIYNPIWEEDIYGLRGLFCKFAGLRNAILDYAPGYAIEAIEEDGSWTASRLQHYPTGGGFLVEHVDSVLASVHDWAGYKQFLQFLLPLSRKGRDFTRGGGYVCIDGEKIIIDDLMQPGDLAIYSGLIAHGVDEIDPHKPLQLGVDSGRVVAFANLYKDFRKNAAMDRRYREIPA